MRYEAPETLQGAVTLLAGATGETRVLAGGTPAPPCYPATILTDVPADAEIAFDETFGPVVIMDVVEDALATGTPVYGLNTGLGPRRNERVSPELLVEYAKSAEARGLHLKHARLLLDVDALLLATLLV